jgi:NitT/TauT family transport system ATP-binding protein
MTFTSRAGPVPVLEDVSLEVGHRDFLAIVGKSGAGKTTLLRIMAGLQRPTAGCVLLDGAPLSRAQSQVCLVFQHYAATLLPWKRALDNVLLGLPTRGAEGRRHHESALDLLAAMDVAPAADRFPWQLSGGMQQRIALARALVRKPKVLLLDEPFSAVDEATRVSLQELLVSLHDTHPCSIVLVTHNLEEVLRLSRRILVMGGSPSRIERVIETPTQVTREALRVHLTMPGSAG